MQLIDPVLEVEPFSHKGSKNENGNLKKLFILGMAAQHLCLANYATGSSAILSGKRTHAQTRRKIIVVLSCLHCATGHFFVLCDMSIKEMLPSNNIIQKHAA